MGKKAMGRQQMLTDGRSAERSVVGASLCLLLVACATSPNGKASNQVAPKDPALEIQLSDDLALGLDEQGKSFFIVEGSILNPTQSPQFIPNMEVTLRDTQKRPVLRWIIKPPVSELEPRASIEFSHLQRDVPSSAQSVTVTWELR